jgi:hypothetical protein
MEDAEIKLFDEWKDRYVGQGNLGFKAFERDWMVADSNCGSMEAILLRSTVSPKK